MLSGFATINVSPATGAEFEYTDIPFVSISRPLSKAGYFRYFPVDKYQTAHCLPTYPRLRFHLTIRQDFQMNFAE